VVHFPARDSVLFFLTRRKYVSVGSGRRVLRRTVRKSSTLSLAGECDRLLVFRK